LLRLWQQGGTPDVAAFLAAVGSLSATELAAVLRVDQRQRWQPGGRLDPARLAILADALEDTAGCTSASLLAHLRNHDARLCGCWVIERLLACRDPSGQFNRPWLTTRSTDAPPLASAGTTAGSHLPKR
jgi:hypothetical protein